MVQKQITRRSCRYHGSSQVDPVGTPTRSPFEEVSEKFLPARDIKIQKHGSGSGRFGRYKSTTSIEF
jgi:hypothetical protein